LIVGWDSTIKPTQEMELGQFECSRHTPCAGEGPHSECADYDSHPSNYRFRVLGYSVQAMMEGVWRHGFQPT
jgi:hypothetical protein